MTCGDGPGLSRDYRVVIRQADFDPDEALTIVEACLAWERTVPGLSLTPSIGQCEGYRERVICVGKQANLPEPHVAETWRTPLVDGAVVYIEPGWVDLSVASHEIGHGMGLHHDAPGTIMCADVTCAAGEPTPDDAMQWYRVRGIIPDAD